jgi:TP901-1 family phage major tail protein
MTAQKGRDFLLKLDQTGGGSYQTVAGLRGHSLSFNTEMVDASSQDTANQWRELLAGAGLKTCAIRGQGIFKDQASDLTVRSYFFNGTMRNWQVTIPSFGVIEGPFQITALDYSGRHDAEVTFELALESAGDLTFTAI